MIASDLSIPMVKLRVLSGSINEEARKLGFESGSAYLEAIPNSEGVIAIFLKEFDITRMERICETTNVFSRSVSDQLAKVSMWRAALKATVEILRSFESEDGRSDAAAQVFIQANMLQQALIEVHNSHVTSMGLERHQAACLITE
ncbi:MULTISPECIES: hypothetical protein [unclassified Stenotrophomonas]|uniref:hypothetical protein n=1 Tax=unclassified Stenotrophomonas TaxID=196198 RepID=UPI0025E11115|nr:MULTISPECIES: hypothetical protein [unclassified Stenotrophomonas]